MLLATAMLLPCYWLRHAGERGPSATMEATMYIQTLTGSPENRRGSGQLSRLLLAPGQFGSRQLAITWVEGAAGSQQPLHALQ